MIRTPSARIATLIVTTCTACIVGGCSDSRQSQIDDAYQRGQITSLHRREMTRQANEEAWAKQEQSRKQFEQQPTGKLAEKMVHPQPVENSDDARK